jgi:hypothetical protein
VLRHHPKGKQDFESTDLSAKMKALLNIAGKVQKVSKEVTTADVDRARREGATDKEIHDTVLIAAAFCMFNRYEDGLATRQPRIPLCIARSASKPRSSATSGQIRKSRSRQSPASKMVKAIGRRLALQSPTPPFTAVYPSRA